MGGDYWFTYVYEAKQRSGYELLGALNLGRGGKVAELSHLLVKRHRHAVAIAVEVVRQLAAHAFADPQMEVLRLQVYAHDTLRNRAYEQAGFHADNVSSRSEKRRERDPVDRNLLRGKGR